MKIIIISLLVLILVVLSGCSYYVTEEEVKESARDILKYSEEQTKVECFDYCLDSEITWRHSGCIDLCS